MPGFAWFPFSSSCWTVHCSDFEYVALRACIHWPYAERTTRSALFEINSETGWHSLSVPDLPKKTFDLNIVDAGDSQFKRLSKDIIWSFYFRHVLPIDPFDALVIVATAYVIWWNPVFWQSKGQLERHLVDSLHPPVLRYKRHLAILAFSKRSFVDGSSPAAVEEASAWLNHRSNLMQGMSIRLASLRLR